jgi:hypothetical protein
MKVLLLVISLIAALLSNAAQALDASKIQIYVWDDVYDDYTRFLNGRHVEEISDFSGQYIRRDVVDMILAQQALVKVTQ